MMKDKIIKFGLGSLAIERSNIEWIKKSIVKIHHTSTTKTGFWGLGGTRTTHHPVYVKIYKVTRVPEYHRFTKEEKEIWDQKFAELVKRVPTEITKSNKTVNLEQNSFWNLHRKDLKDNIKNGEIKPESIGQTKESLMKIYEELIDYAQKNVYNPKVINISREYYFTVPYFLFNDKTNQDTVQSQVEALKQDEAKLVALRKENEAKAKSAYDKHLDKLNGFIHTFQEERIMEEFFANVDRTMNEIYPEHKILDDEELATFHNSRYYQTLYIQDKKKDYFLRILDFIDLAAHSKYGTVK